LVSCKWQSKLLLNLQKVYRLVSLVLSKQWLTKIS
jgi:hypothetical protein